MAASDRELAKQIIVEIILQAGGTLDNKTNLFKAFYYAHVHFAQKNSGYLSTWPIVRMPNGPGISSAGALLSELVEEEVIRVKPILKGNHTGFRFRARKKAKSVLPCEAVEAIAYGVKQVKDRSAAAVSHGSHVASRSWRDAINGEELNIYVDGVPEDEYANRNKEISNLISGLRSAMNQ